MVRFNSFSFVSFYMYDCVQFKLLSVFVWLFFSFHFISYNFDFVCLFVYSIRYEERVKETCVCMRFYVCLCMFTQTDGIKYHQFEVMLTHEQKKKRIEAEKRMYATALAAM